MAAIAIRLAVRPPLIAVAAISLAALAAIAAFAQTPAPVTLSGLFDPDLAELKLTEQLKDAIKKAHRGDCYPPRATFKVVVAAGGADPLFLTTLANARYEALASALKQPSPGAPAPAGEGALASLGVNEGQFKPGSILVEGNLDYVQVSYDKFKPDDDKDAPTLNVTWVPRDGSKVKVGDQIKVTITASERYKDGHKSWPTGVFNIQLTADDGLVDSKNYGRAPDPCATPTFTPKPYTVPRNPPRIVHLTAMAEDAVGNKNIKVGEFYTVEVWHGTWENFFDITSYDGVQYNRIKRDEVVTFDLYETSKDKLEGQAHATWTFSEEVTAGKCAGSKLIQDPKTVAWDAQLTGSITHWPESTRFEFHATPDRGRPYKVINTPGGECTTGGTEQWNDNEWSGTNFDLRSGQDHIDEVHNIPPTAPEETGQHYYKFHVESSGK